MSNKHDKGSDRGKRLATRWSVAEIKEAVDSGYFFMKIKIGQPGTQDEMLAKDMARGFRRFRESAILALSRRTGT